MDFTVKKYEELLDALKGHGRFSLRHDVDLRPEFALRIAQAEVAMGVTATYYFRAMHFDSHAGTIRAIVALGHRAGYHYESLTTCQGNTEAAYTDFCANLDRLRRLVPVSTACAHGSPRSPWNSQSLWQTDPQPNTPSTSLPPDIHSFGIDYEPMLDTDFSSTLYLTDTGRRWDGYRVSVRDKVPQYQERWILEGLTFHSTSDIIRALSNPSHPIHRYRLLINTHPQRWMPFGLGWIAEAAMQHAKNMVKGAIVARKK